MSKATNANASAALAAGAGAKKMGYVRYVQLSDITDTYVISMLRSFHGKEVHTQAEWDQIVKDELGRKVN